MAKHREAEQEKEENSERWVVTYADMITLLLAFFIMMYAMSQLNQGKFQRMVQSYHVHLGLESSASPIASMPGGMVSGGPGILAGALAVALEKALGPGMKESVEVFSDETEDTVTVRILADGLLFRPGRAEILPAVRPVLDEVARELRKRHGAVRIEGHTCDLPTANAQFPSNWELSAQRAVNVLRFLAGEKRLAASRLSAAAFAATRPVVPNNSEANRRRNRRVDLVLLNVSSDAPPPVSGERPTAVAASPPVPTAAPAAAPAPPSGPLGPPPVVAPPPQIVPPIRIAP